MRPLCRVVPMLVLVWLGWQQVRADDDEVVARQKKKAQDNWKRVYDKQPAVHVQTDSFLFYASKSFEKEQLKDWGGMLDGLYKETKKALGLDAEGKKPVWVGKLTIYLFDDR